MVPSIPQEVHEAFTRLKRTWSSYLNEDEINLMYLVLVGTHAVGDALTLKKFAMNNPTTYFKAIANGYTVKDPGREKEVAAMIKKWMLTPYKDDDINKDIMRFAQDLTHYFQKHT